MSLSPEGLTNAVIAALNDRTGIDLDSGHARTSIGRIAEAVVEEIQDRGRVRVDIEIPDGNCTNTHVPPAAPTPGSYIGTARVKTSSSRGRSPTEIYGLDRTQLANRLRTLAETDTIHADYRRTVERTMTGLAKGIVKHIHNRGKIRTPLTALVNEFVRAGGQTVDGTATFDKNDARIHGLDADGMKQSIQDALREAHDPDPDFDEGAADQSILDLATGIVNHIHRDARVTIEADFTVICPSIGGPRPSTGQETDAAIS